MKNIFKGLLAIFIYFILYFFTPVIISFLPIDPSNMSMNIKYIINIVYELITLFIIVLILKEDVLNDFKIYFKNVKQFLQKYIKYWLIALLLMYISNFIIINISGDIAQNEQSVRQLFDVNPIFTFILASLIAPILEELIFRLSIYKIIGKYKWVYIILSGLLFGSMHILSAGTNLYDYLYLIPYSIPGCIFAYTLVKSNNIFVPISLHFIHNTFSLVLQMIASVFGVV